MADITYRFVLGRRFQHRLPTDAAQARERLERGSREFAALLSCQGDTQPHAKVIECQLSDLGQPGHPGKVPPHRPYAVVLGCSDARVPTELIFTEGSNTLFIVRVAGNVLGAECIGSIDFAVRQLCESVRLLVVLGHTECGAVSAAVDAFLRPSRYSAIAPTHSLRSIVDRLSVAVRRAAACLSEERGPDVEQRPGYREALVAVAVSINAALGAHRLRQEYGKANCIEVVYGVYDQLNRRVRLPMSDCDIDSDAGLHKAPAAPEDMAELCHRLAGSPYVERLLGPP